jgi:hypothetical protein
MNPDRWAEVERLYHGAAALPSASARRSCALPGVLGNGRLSGASRVR